LSIVILVGSATPPGRTHTVAVNLANALRSQQRVGEIEIIDLAAVAFEAADGRPVEAYDATVRDAAAKIGAADGLLIASPVYRATYAGVLKNFLDILPVEALRDKPVGLAVVGGSLHHYLGVDLGLRAVLAWFGALALPTSVYLTGTDFTESKQVGQGAGEQLAALARTLCAFMAARSETGEFGPAPLAARRT
jgi:FMN reductase